ncbi:hypothetical protein SBC1_78970 (plasmid) [Caballeronia sp. SBC1]|uniref:hypothetical protein n=1 Tax=Caballeronia sp. SBC1 TaxID=2705548 RepID=UPI001409C937|nr:hypothetical protein [Caballeronia sp. SBC1]QIN67850.1 hypothetical protein SBC1_78970 [Caballeronia sp. SBC1]
MAVNFQQTNEAMQEFLGAAGYRAVAYGEMTAIGRTNGQGACTVAHFAPEQADAVLEKLSALGGHAVARPTSVPGKYVVAFEQPERKSPESNTVQRIEAVAKTVDGLTKALMQVLEMIASGSGDAKALATTTLHRAGMWAPEKAAPAPAVAEVIRVPVDVLGSLLAMANSHVAEIESGLEDGTYEVSENLDLTKMQEAIKVAEELYRF